MVSYPVDASIKVIYEIEDDPVITQTFNILTYTLTAETQKLIMDKVNELVCDKVDVIKSVSALKFFLSLL